MALTKHFFSVENFSTLAEDRGFTVDEAYNEGGFRIGRLDAFDADGESVGYVDTYPDEEGVFHGVLADDAAEYAEYMDEERDEPWDGFNSDAEADADVLASAGYGTDEDYGYFGGDDY